MGPRQFAIYDYSFQVVCVDAEGNVIEKIGEMNNGAVARAAFEAAATQYAWSTIRLRNGARIMEDVRTGGYDSETKTIPIIERRS
ncbi:hypothetical protein [Mesorhizobium sp. B2-8-9]|uniref:hypothetical protein n=1 Tax=Mesorhizobium sp. B2-8-9 TaxID=2589899 RepID=UPI00112E24A7|nr:hypothetical protein [Mesorhizobium sp. B2-8-9]TPI86419.1 hypothetical protein FJ423_00930 [Mesorhizobium sp. B2-8-9]